MSIQTPNPISRAEVSVAFRASPTLHPDYTYWSEHWETIRDCEIGEIEVKRKREKYLPKMQNQSAEQYNTFLRRGVFFNMTARTLNALYGTAFRRAPKVTGLRKAEMNKARSITKDGTSLHLLAKTAVKEVLALGRFGMLVDAAPDGAGDPYIACYTAENILDWEMGEVNGKWQLVRVVLREIFYDRGRGWSPYTYHARFRVLTLVEVDEGHVYEQHIYDDRESHGLPDIDSVPDSIITPEVRGEPIDYIPFVVVGPFTNHPDVSKPPMLDIVTLNLSHYLSYAALEHGRFYTGSPIYTVQVGAGEGTPEYYVGPDVVWQLGPNESASILEFNGSGLKSLENALQDKEAQISAIGGRLMPGTARGAAESDNSLMLKEQNEQTLLLNIADTVDEALTTVVRWWADWSNITATRIAAITFEINRDFMLKEAGAREFRAIHQMYKDGILPVEIVFQYLQKEDVIPEWMEFEEFVGKLKDADQFPNMVDVLARMKNFPDAESFHEFEMMKRNKAAAGIVTEPGPADPDNPPTQSRGSGSAAGQ